jgi:ABC-2 type transport system permease protein
LPNNSTTAAALYPAIASLAWREWVRFVRQPNRVIGALGQPILFWLLFGSGFGASMRLTQSAETLDYGEYFFPGTLVLILLFTAIFATISIIEDRREGFLQGVLTSPAPRLAMVLGKLIGGTLIAVAQASVFLLLGWLTRVALPWQDVLLTIPALFVLGLALTAIGFTMAWRLDSTQGFHALMSVFLLPMWLLSGAFFHAGDNVVGWIVRLNPLTYGVALVRHLLYFGASDETRLRALPADLPGLGLCLGVTAAFVIGTCGLAWLTAGRRSAGDLL